MTLAIIWAVCGFAFGVGAGWKLRELLTRRIDRTEPRPVYVIEPKIPPDWQAVIDDIQDQYEAARRQILQLEGERR